MIPLRANRLVTKTKRGIERSFRATALVSWSVGLDSKLVLRDQRLKKIIHEPPLLFI
jgi:hypothetical protein